MLKTMVQCSAESVHSPSSSSPSCCPSSSACVVGSPDVPHSSRHRDTSPFSLPVSGSTNEMRHMILGSRGVIGGSPGTNTIMSRPHSSSLLHCRIRHSNLALRTMLPSVSWRRIHIRPRQPIRQTKKTSILLTSQSQCLAYCARHAVATVRT